MATASETAGEPISVGFAPHHAVGLPNSEAELFDAGLSRLENKVHLGGLT